MTARRPCTRPGHRSLRVWGPGAQAALGKSVFISLVPNHGSIGTAPSMPASKNKRLNKAKRDSPQRGTTISPRGRVSLHIHVPEEGRGRGGLSSRTPGGWGQELCPEPGRGVEKEQRVKRKNTVPQIGSPQFVKDTMIEKCIRMYASALT